MYFSIINLKGTTDSNGIIYSDSGDIDLSKKITYIDCISNTISRDGFRCGIIIFEDIENSKLRFRIAATNNTSFTNYQFNTYVLMVYKLG